jgi:hypothetical protein
MSTYFTAPRECLGPELSYSFIIYNPWCASYFLKVTALLYLRYF